MKVEIRIFFSTNGTGIIGVFIQTKMNSHCYFMPHTNIYLKWIIYLNIKARTMMLLTENIGDYLSDFGIDKDFLHRT